MGEDFHILRYDGRGQGKSDCPEGIYHLDDQVEDLFALLEKYQIGNCALVGLSNGGRVALRFADLHSEMVWALAIADTYANPSRALKLKISSWLAAHEIGGALHRFDVATPWIWSESMIENSPELIEFYRQRAALMPEQVVYGLISGALEGQVNVENIVCPVLLMVGQEDILTTQKNHDELFKLMMAHGIDCQSATVAGGHASLIEHPEIMGEWVRPFLNNIWEHRNERLQLGIFS